MLATSNWIPVFAGVPVDRCVNLEIKLGCWDRGSRGWICGVAELHISIYPHSRTY